MNPLDNKSILVLRKILEPTTKGNPYAMLYNDHVVVTNHGWLMEWPIDLVDLECSRFNKLLDNQKQQEFQTARERLQKEGWRSVLLDPAGKLAKVEEAEPNQDDLDHDQIIYTYRKTTRIQYGAHNFDAVETFIDDPHYRLYRPAKHEQYPKEFMPLVIHEEEGGEPVGIFMNDYPRPCGPPRTARGPEDA
jgi:hypothetical protein